MGVTAAALLVGGFQYDDPKKPYAMDGFANSKDAVEALEFYKSLYKCCTPPGYTNAYMQEGLDAFKSGQVAMQMNWFAFFPGLSKDEKVGGDRIGFFVNPARRSKPRRSAARASRWCPIRRTSGGAAYIKWFAQPDVQKKWWSLGGYAVHKAVVEDPGHQVGAFRGRLPQGHGGREGLQGGAGLCAAPPRHAEARARLCGRREGHREGGSISWSRIGRRPSTKKARSDDAQLPGPGARGVRPGPSSPWPSGWRRHELRGTCVAILRQGRRSPPADAAFRLRACRTGRSPGCSSRRPSSSFSPSTSSR